MKREAMWTKAAIYGLVAAAALVVACQPPVSNEAALVVEGRILGVDGQPLANQAVNLWKSDLPLFEDDTLIGISIEAGQPFRIATTDADGRYRFDLKGAEANTGGQRFAAYFAVTATQGSDKSLAVASAQFGFSNQALTHSAPDLQFWDGGAVAPQGEALRFQWDASPTGADNQEYVLVVDGGIWSEATSATTLDVSTHALPAEQDTHRFLVLALRDGIRYRTSFKTFTASNPLGAGIDFKQPENNNISATDCDGNNLFNLNDGVFTGRENEENFQTSPGDAARCVSIKLAAPTALSELVVHNGWISGLDGASVTISARPEGGEWKLLDTQDGAQASLMFYYRHLRDLDPAPVSEIKIEVLGGSARFYTLGEVVLYPAARN
jgi:hypothetical protein